MSLLTTEPHPFKISLGTDAEFAAGVPVLAGEAVENLFGASRPAGHVRGLDALRLTEARYRRLFETAQDGILILDAATGQVVDANPFMQVLLGYSLEEFLGKKLWEIGPFKGIEASKTIFAELQVKDSVRYERLSLEKQGGGRVEAEFISNAYVAEGRRLIQCNIRDITERQRIEESLRASEERFRQVVESIREVFWIIDVAKDRVIYVSPSYKEVWGQEPGKLYISRERFSETIHPEDRTRYQQVAREKPVAGNYDETYRIIRPDGTLRWIHSKAFPVRNAVGEVYRIVGVSEDITERKQHEEQSLRAQRLESIGMLAAGITHDLNNVLAPIGMAVSLLRNHVSASSDLRLLDILDRSAERGAGLVRQILGFVHGVGGEPRLVQIGHLLRDIAAIITQTFPKSISLKEEVPGDLWPVLANPTQIHQVLLNLCVNARDAMPQGGILHLRAENCVLDTDAARAIEGAAPGAWLMLEVGDTGTGIPPEILARIWEPFFTTKGAGKGTGLGLSTVRGIVETYRGFTNLMTAPGQGTLIQVYLPADTVALAQGGSTSPMGAADGHGELILLSDDEPSIRDVATSILTNAGYRVLTAADGGEAETIFAARGAELALVITDLDMPVMDGETLCHHIRGARPALKILAMSGIGSRYIKAKPCEFASQFMAKPFTAGALLDHVRQLLPPGITRTPTKHPWPESLSSTMTPPSSN